MSRVRIVALVAMPVLLLGGCRAGLGSDDGAGPSPGGGAPVVDSGGSDGSGGSGASSGGVQQQFDDVESTLSSIEHDMAGD